mmetsp:Transcript_23431/g.65691  ORF Transcript_23431/g.65691 Transcript_23431/m.65691 type:complete len:234 (-) Transcript_23431:444-1145(-)
MPRGSSPAAGPATFAHRAWRAWSPSLSAASTAAPARSSASQHLAAPRAAARWIATRPISSAAPPVGGQPASISSRAHASAPAPQAACRGVTMPSAGSCIAALWPTSTWATSVAPFSQASTSGVGVPRPPPSGDAAPPLTISRTEGTSCASTARRSSCVSSMSSTASGASPREMRRWSTRPSAAPRFAAFSIFSLMPRLSAMRTKRTISSPDDQPRFDVTQRTTQWLLSSSGRR